MIYYLFTDLDRTILPNGRQPESPLARVLLHGLAAQEWLQLVYVSGRDLGLLRQAIREFELPVPAFAIGDVGTTMYRVTAGDWQPVCQWQDEIARCWPGLEMIELEGLLADIPLLTKQEPAKQGQFKLSYYLPCESLARGWHEVNRRLAAKGVKAAVITSIDETAELGFLDVLPVNATKLHAVRFLIAHTGILPQQAVYSGDSGNDMPVLISDIQSVLVANAEPRVREEACTLARQAGTADKLYLARGGFGLNGNYAAGVLEGAAHYLPPVRQWLEATSAANGYSPEVLALWRPPR